MNQPVMKKIWELSIGDQFKDPATDRIFRITEKFGNMAEVWDVYNEKFGVWPANATVEVVPE